jgi:hypothetical protein
MDQLKTDAQTTQSRNHPKLCFAIIYLPLYISSRCEKRELKFARSAGRAANSPSMHGAKLTLAAALW